MKNLVVVVVLFACLSPSFAAKKKKVEPSYASIAENIVNRYQDSLQQIKKYYDSAWVYNKNDVLKNPYYYRLFFQPTLYDSPLAQSMESQWVGAHNRGYRTYSAIDTRDHELACDSALNDFFANFYIAHPQLIRVTENQLAQDDGIRKEVIAAPPIKHEVTLSERIKPVVPVEVVEPLNVISHRPNFWDFSANVKLQYSQFYSSNNWFQGQNTYNSLYTNLYLAANYNFNEKVVSQNSLNIQLGFQTEKGDTIHHFHPTSDEIRMVNKLNIRAIKNWSYSLQIQSVTQMFPHYNSNSHYVYSDFMSPFNSTASLGMNYSWNKKIFSMSLNIGALAYKFNCVDRKALQTRYGLPATHHFRSDYGSTVTLNYSLQLLKELSWSARVYYFTNYSKVQAEWENTFRFKINKYMSTTFYVYPRFDDTQYDERHRHRIQLKQTLMVGFEHAF